MGDAGRASLTASVPNGSNTSPLRPVLNEPERSRISVYMDLVTVRYVGSGTRTYRSVVCSSGLFFSVSS